MPRTVQLSLSYALSLSPSPSVLWLSPPPTFPLAFFSLQSHCSPLHEPQSEPLRRVGTSQNDDGEYAMTGCVQHYISMTCFCEMASRMPILACTQAQSLCLMASHDDKYNLSRALACICTSPSKRDIDIQLADTRCNQVRRTNKHMQILNSHKQETLTHT